MECREVNVDSTEPVVYIYIDTERKKIIACFDNGVKKKRSVADISFSFNVAGAEWK